MRHPVTGKAESPFGVIAHLLTNQFYTGVARLVRHLPTEILMNCLNCNVETTNPRFCSRSCSCTYTNKQNPRRFKKVRYCSCGNDLTGRKKVCDSCSRRGDMTLREAIYNEGYKRTSYALVRARARNSVSGEPQCCEVCGYDKYVEVAHVKAIASFELDTLVSVINDRSNLRLLCPNHHWELDNL